VNPQVSKSRALGMVADRLGVARAEVAAIGDNLNDQDMVSWAGLGVAMGNAPEALKGVARYVTGRIGEAGVAQVIEQFVIGRNELPLRA
jgi:hydroxymethylpyrimidine pyrophosphatase-like HAD family hydrolase